MKILVTGANGFVAQHLIRELLDRGHEIIASSRDEHKARTRTWFHKVTFLPMDLASFSPAKLYDSFLRPDLLFHLAWDTLDRHQDPVHYEDHLLRHYAFLKEMIQQGLPGLAVSGTCAEYGNLNGCLEESLPCVPVTAYGVAKDSLRRFLEQLLREYPIPFYWIRLFYIYGPGQRQGSLLPSLEQALNSGKSSFILRCAEQIKDFVSIENAVRYMACSVSQDRFTGIINCCSGRPVSVRGFVESYLQKSGRHIKLHLDHSPADQIQPLASWGDRKRLDAILRQASDSDATRMQTAVHV